MWVYSENKRRGSTLNKFSELLAMGKVGIC